MNVLWCLITLASIFTGYHSFGVQKSSSARPDVVNIGSILTFDSVIGKVAKVAIEAAVDDVNSSSNILRGTKLNITMCNCNFTGFSGIIDAVRFMETENVALIGPQSTVTAIVLSYFAVELHIPLLSFLATDPTLSPLQFPYFVRTGVNDLFQMTAIADMIKYHGWRDVVAVFVDDDYGRNGLGVLADQLAARSCQISYRAPLKQDAAQNDIRNALIEVALVASSRILVVHTYPEKGLDIMNIAHDLGMMQQGYVWIATNWLSTVLDTNHPLSSQATSNIQGVLTLRIHTPNTETKKSFVSRWRGLTAGEAVRGPIGLSTHALHAYDTVWMVARAIDAFLDSNGNISFTSYARRMGSLKLKTFDGGEVMLSNILNVNMKGVTGTLTFTPQRDLINPAFEIINLVGNGYKRIGYWSNTSGLSTSPPEKLMSNNYSPEKLLPAIWPGETAVKPRGWVFPNNGRQLRIGVPIRVSFQEFVARVPGKDIYTGYCIDVFTAAMSLLPYAVPYRLIPYGDEQKNPSCNELIHLIATGEYDAAIGDIAITTERIRMADFTQPYVESGLVVVAPVRNLHSSTWAFLQPFTTSMWSVTGLFFLAGGAIVWIVEHRVNEDFRGPPRKQLVTVLWFSFSTLFFSHRERTLSWLGRLILPVWLFAIFIIKSSYTASLTSILTVQQLSSPIKGIESLMEGDELIGYQQGSFARDYLVEQLGISESRLVSLTTPESYASALDDGRVAAVVDERAYIELFLSTRCQFTIVGPEFTSNGWGFAFPKESPMALDMSTAIVKLSENGEMNRIHDKWLQPRACSSQGAKLQVDRLSLSSFVGLFFICGVACLFALVVCFIKMLRKFNLHYSHHEMSSTSSSSRATRLQTFFSFVDDKDESVKARRVRRKTESDSSTSMEPPTCVGMS